MLNLTVHISYHSDGLKENSTVKIFHRVMNTDSRFWGFGTVCRMFVDDVSGAAVGPIFNGNRLKRE